MFWDFNFQILNNPHFVKHHYNEIIFPLNYNIISFSFLNGIILTGYLGFEKYLKKEEKAEKFSIYLYKSVKRLYKSKLV